MIKKHKIFANKSREDIRLIILQTLEKGFFKNSSPYTCDRDEWYEMKQVVHELHFNSGTSSSEGWETFTIGGLKGKDFSNESSIGIITIVRQVDWGSKIVSHHMNINYRTSTGAHVSYMGNLVDFCNQLINLTKIAEASEKFGL